jgi:hypothetical protein
MTLRRVRVAVLCEDADHERFARHYLRGRGVDISRHFRALPLAQSQGSGEQAVRIGYASAVQAHRSKAHDASVSLIVITDADHLTIPQRRKTLDDALDTGGQLPRQPTERIAILIPKRNIETWVAHLNGGAVDETVDYKPQTAPAFKSAAEALPQACSSTPAPVGRPPSLTDACSELQRLDG